MLELPLNLINFEIRIKAYLAILINLLLKEN